MNIPVVNGNRGEFYALTTDKACEMVTEVAGRAPLLAGVGRTLPDAVQLARASADAEGCGADGASERRSTFLYVLKEGLSQPAEHGSVPAAPADRGG